MGCHSLFQSNSVSEKLLDCKTYFSSLKDNDQLKSKSKPISNCFNNFSGWDLEDPNLFNNKSSNFVCPKSSSQTNGQSNNSNHSSISASTISSYIKNQASRCKSFKFHHYENIYQYIDQYRTQNSSTSSANVSQETNNKLLLRTGNATSFTNNGCLTMQHGSTHSFGNVATIANLSNEPTQQPSSCHLPHLQDGDFLNNLNITNGMNSNQEKNSTAGQLTYSRVAAANASYINGIYTVAQKYHLTPPTFNQYSSWTGLKPLPNQNQQTPLVKPAVDLAEPLSVIDNGISYLHGKPLNLEPKRRQAGQLSCGAMNPGRMGVSLSKQFESNLPRTAGLVNAKLNNMGTAEDVTNNSDAINNSTLKTIKDGNSVDFGRILEEKLLHIQKLQGHAEQAGFSSNSNSNKRATLSRQASANKRLTTDRMVDQHRRFEPEFLYQQSAWLNQMKERTKECQRILMRRCYSSKR